MPVRPMRAPGGPDGPGPKAQRGPTRVRPTRAQGGPQGPGAQTWAHKGPAHQSPGAATTERPARAQGAQKGPDHRPRGAHKGLAHRGLREAMRAKPATAPMSGYICLPEFSAEKISLLVLFPTLSGNICFNALGDKKDGRTRSVTSRSIKSQITGMHGWVWVYDFCS